MLIRRNLIVNDRAFLDRNWSSKPRNWNENKNWSFFGLFDKNVGWVFPRKFILILFRERGSSVIDVTVEEEEVNRYQWFVRTVMQNEDSKCKVIKVAKICYVYRCNGLSNLKNHRVSERYFLKILQVTSLNGTEDSLCSFVYVLGNRQVFLTMLLLPLLLFNDKFWKSIFFEDIKMFKM